MRPVLVCLLGACGFSASTSDVVIDAPPEVPLPPCSVAPTAEPGSDRGRVGGDGGGDNLAPASCPNNTVMVGIAVYMSNEDTLYGARSAHGLTIACAPVTIDRNTGAVTTTGMVEAVERMGTGTNGWAPSTQTAVAMCPPGEVINGLEARTGSGSNLFKEVRFRCGRLDRSAATIGTSTIYVQGSLMEPDGVRTINCDTNEIVTQFSVRTGAGFDSANVFCSPAHCL